ncbi:hypothetical protein FNF27_00125 [Cafeteria roenbergensis]|uniref:TauD/TfdA-like domain-containing protein n=2 Tax=Cafeteria roenbergensis TaxID=33653 RepID=A0A5A8EL73_CAFRO|nr:hypothetical protein FNF29_03422 [Cafeteria roenbergensis]KAA0164245.1 hypothetical protein FNF31_02481 [Cafeteria roenbergensis]KAA0168727.1 hypothetical protein FNF28_02464 [Cafeteria roenbergensis]KAA0178272.1 hypothetical protein FNF27_00125 [Cafeteria roenbergensis]|eukprot:KAA0152898.1 hypothetical protein FNF29_03422 [Cafeteria roenbergensis]
MLTRQLGRALAAGRGPAARGLATASCAGGESVTIRNDSSELANLSAHFLRAECYCPECRHGATNQRLVDIAASAGVTAHSAAIAEDGSLKVAFSDGHASTFAPRWLELHSRSSEPDGSRLRRISSLAECLEAQGGPALPESQRPLPLDAPPRAPWAAIEEGGSQLAGVLRNFRRHGAVVLEGAATGDDVIERLAQALGGERATHYGARFHVLSKQQPDSLANTGHALGYHTDLPYRAEVPSVQALHCQQSDAEGGLSLLTDGFAAAEQLYKDDPMAFAELACTPLSFCWQGREGVLLRAQRPVIELCQNLTLRAVNFDNRNVRLRLLPESLGGVAGKSLLEAYSALGARIDAPEKTLKFRLEPGEVMMFHNRRLLHGRTAFDASSGARKLHGCYLDMDMIESTERALELQAEGAMTRFDAPDFARGSFWDA